VSTYAELRQQAEAAWRAVESPPRPRVAVSLNTSSIAVGAEESLAALRSEVERRGLVADVAVTGDTGLSYEEPVVEVAWPDGRRILYRRITADMVPRLVEEVLVKDGMAPELALAVASGQARDGVPELTSLDFWKVQTRRLMANCGVIDPENIDHYIARGGYEGLAKALEGMSQEEVIKEVSDSSLWGRGGAAFPAGRKWDFLRTAKRTPKYMICNADEGDPGAFVNRVLLESDPHGVLEGILLGGYATGASHAFIYIRHEYPLAFHRLNAAIQQAREKGLLGEHILGSDFSFDMEVVRGAGSYVCGEESGLIASVDDDRGMPRIRPPYPAQSGVFARPTNVNNVETYAYVSSIIRHGAAWYRELGTEQNPGTKMFSLSGHVARVGILEVPFGTPVRVLLEAAGGVPDGRALKAIQAGGPLAGLLPARFIDIPLEPEAFREQGAQMGGGGIVFVDDSVCVIDLDVMVGHFVEDESCGRCTTCRGGTQRMVDILERIAAGGGRESDFERLQLLGRTIPYANCAHGQAAPTIMLNTLEHFTEEYRQHVLEKRCPARVCKGLIRYEVVRESNGLQEAADICPTRAVVQEAGRWRIDQALCIKCDACREVAPEAIEVVDALVPVAERG